MWCRPYTAEEHKPTNPARLRQREKLSANDVACEMKMKTVADNGFVKISRHGDCTIHCHDLETVDRKKLPSWIMELARSKIAEGTKASAVAANLAAEDRPKDREILRAAGGHWLTLMDVPNAGSEWKQKNPDLRRVGTDFAWEQQRIEAFDWLSKQKGAEGT